MRDIYLIWEVILEFLPELSKIFEIYKYISKYLGDIHLN